MTGAVIALSPLALVVAIVAWRVSRVVAVTERSEDRTPAWTTCQRPQCHEHEHCITGECHD